MGPVAKSENGREMGRAGLPFTTTIREQPSVTAEPIRPFLASLTNFATGPLEAGQFRWPKVQDGVVRLTAAELAACQRGASLLAYSAVSQRWRER